MHHFNLLTAPTGRRILYPHAHRPMVERMMLFSRRDLPWRNNVPDLSDLDKLTGD